jgi:hypothetical protein
MIEADLQRSPPSPIVVVTAAAQQSAILDNRVTAEVVVDI